MAHAPGWTLGTLAVEYHSTLTNDAMFNIFHYDCGTFPANQANADASSVAANAYFAGGIGSLISTATDFIQAVMLLDDGVNQFSGGITLTPVTGSASGVPLSQVLCGIVRKRAVGKGRKRFGHTCHPGISAGQCDDPNTLSATTVNALTAFYAGVNDPSTNFALPGAFHVLYNLKNDTRQVVVEIYGHKDLKTSRRRTPGRGI